MAKPGVIIGTLEDSPAWLDQRLVSAYLKTRYWVGWPDEKGSFLSIGMQNPLLGEFLKTQNIHSFAIITAWNPFSEQLEIAENEERNARLANDLQSCARLILPARNISHDGSWPVEEGFCACGIDRDTVFTLGRKYGQNAVVHWEKEAVELWWIAGV